MAYYTVSFIPQNKSIKVKKGTTLLDAAKNSSLVITSVCGGGGICGRCKMIIKEGNVRGGISPRLTDEEKRKGYVLACMAHIESDVIIELPQETVINNSIRNNATKTFLKDEIIYFRDKWKEAHPLVKKIYMELPKPSLQDPRADHERVYDAVWRGLHVSSLRMDIEVIKRMPTLLRENNFQVTVTVGFRRSFAEILAIEGGNTEHANYTIVVDIGTTTLVGYLLNSFTREIIDKKSLFNSQYQYGGDVIARLLTAEKNGLGLLHETIIGDVKQLTQQFVADNKIRLQDIMAVVCAGNTVMMHFLLDLPIYEIRRSPYVPVSVGPPPIRARDCGITINERGLLYMIPGISSWIGGDITAGILRTGIYESEGISLFVDIGTNGEIVVGNKEWLVAASASAGPALEGASLACGMRAEDGAIEKVYEHDGKIVYSTIGKKPAQGLCGSGIIDLVSILFKKGILNRRGKLLKNRSDKVCEVDGINRFILVRENENGSEKYIYITELDIDNIITAKAALFAAIKILFKRLDLSFQILDRVFIAGTFGNSINIESAINIGLLPCISPEKISFVGNTSLQGASIAAFCEEAFTEMIKIREKMTYYDLMGAHDYVEEFEKALFLPHTSLEEFFVT
ncbi:ASKHA domain-containing protein [Chlamydiota bacterium]